MGSDWARMKKEGQARRRAREGKSDTRREKGKSDGGGDDGVPVLVKIAHAFFPIYWSNNDCCTAARRMPLVNPSTPRINTATHPSISHAVFSACSSTAVQVRSNSAINPSHPVTDLFSQKAPACEYLNLAGGKTNWLPATCSAQTNWGKKTTTRMTGHDREKFWG